MSGAARLRPGLALLVLLPTPSLAAGEPGPGAYCPLPAAGQKPACLEPAVAEYGDFFHAVDAGEASDADVARVETDLARGAGTAEGYLALSSLAYGYYRLSEQAARTPGTDAAIAARLERWNELLGAAYASAPETAPWRTAVREAADDLHERAPAVELRCRDAQGETAPCASTEAMLLGLDATAAEVGYRGGLERVLERLFGDDDS